MNDFEEIFQHVALHTLVGRDRLAVLYYFSRRAAMKDGDIAEVGVYRGGTSVLLARANPHAIVHAFDTFVGIPNAKADVDVHQNGDFDLGGNTPEILTAEKNIRIHPGLFPETAEGEIREFPSITNRNRNELPKLGSLLASNGNEFYCQRHEISDSGAKCHYNRTHLPAIYCFAHFDGDTYESCVAFIKYFRLRMTTGGIMVFDDYRWHKCPGVERALHESFSERQIIQSASIQAMVIV